MNLAMIIEHHDAAAVALVSRGKATTYGDLRRQVAGLRGGLAALGLRPGDRLALLCANNWYFVVSYLAGLGAGLVVVPLDPASPARALQAELAAVGARAVVVGPAARPTFARIDLGALPALEHVIDSGTPLQGPWLLLDDLLAAAPADITPRGPDDLAILMFTSGTAGAPKPAMLSHGNLGANLGGRTRVQPDDVVLGVVPLHHILGLNGLLGPTLHGGGRMVLVERFDPASARDTVVGHGVTVLAGTPDMWAGLAGLPDVAPGQFTSVRVAVSGASALPGTVRDLVEVRMALVVAEGYGLTEHSPVVTSSTSGPAKAGSVGRPLPGVEVRLVGDDGADVGTGGIGEVWVRGPSVFRGYWQDPVATAAALTPDGWLRTGDVARVDDDGCYVLVDRIKDVIMVSGVNVYPAEVEGALLGHPGVAGVVVVGVPHPYTGQAVKAFVVPDDHGAIEEDDVVDFCRQRLAAHKCPTKVEFVDRLPAGSAGKVLRRDVHPA